MFKKLWVRIQAPYSGWTFSHRFVVKIVVCLKRPKINEKEAGDGPFKKTISTQSECFKNNFTLDIIFTGSNPVSRELLFHFETANWKDKSK